MGGRCGTSGSAGEAESLVLYRDAARPEAAERISGLLTELQQADCGSEQVEAMARRWPEGCGNCDSAEVAGYCDNLCGGMRLFLRDRRGWRISAASVGRGREGKLQAGFFEGARVWVGRVFGLYVQERELLVEIARPAESMEIALCLIREDLLAIRISMHDRRDCFKHGTEYAELSGVFSKCTLRLSHR